MYLKSISVSASRAFIATQFQPLLYAVRHYANGPTFFTTPYAFDMRHANGIFLKDDHGQWFRRNHGDQDAAVTVVKGRPPLQKVLIPVCLFSAAVKSVRFHAEYGVENTEYVYINKQLVPQTYTTWYPYYDKIGPAYYGKNRPGNQIYAGFEYPTSYVETILQQEDVGASLIPFEPSKMDGQTVIDPYLLRTPVIHEIAHQRIHEIESERVEKYVRQRTGYSQIRIRKVHIQFEALNLKHTLLPTYVLQYPNSPPRILAALNLNHKIVGPASLSTTKVTVAGTIAASALAVAFPGVSLAARLLFPTMVGAVSGLWARYRLNTINSYHKGHAKDAREYNDALSESKEDAVRREQTQKFSPDKQEPKAQDLVEVDRRHFAVLGLSPKQYLSEQIVQEAFARRLKQVHPDVTGQSPDQTRDLIKARTTIMAAIKRRQPGGHNQQRFFSTVRSQVLAPADIGLSQVKRLQ